MKYSKFLPGVAELLRKKAWTVFKNAEREAKQIIDGHNTFVKIKGVNEGNKNTWEENGIITITVDRDDLGVIYHEVFHSAFHKSHIWQIDENGDKQWGNGFCDAFRYLMEQKYLLGKDESDFMKRFQVGLKKPGQTTQNESIKRGARIIQKLNQNQTLEGFRDLWGKLCTKNNLDLDGYFS